MFLLVFIESTLSKYSQMLLNSNIPCQPLGKLVSLVFKSSACWRQRSPGPISQRDKQSLFSHRHLLLSYCHAHALCHASVGYRQVKQMFSSLNGAPCFASGHWKTWCLFSWAADTMSDAHLQRKAEFWCTSLILDRGWFISTKVLLIKLWWFRPHSFAPCVLDLLSAYLNMKHNTKLCH